jgi:D-3-phosphoglycerate dehydrogenase
VKVLITDSDYPDLSLEKTILHDSGFELSVAQCHTPGEVIEAAQGAGALLVQYAPVTREVVEQLPELGIISRYGVGVDTINLEAAQSRGIWVSNVPDYGVEEVASHAAAMVLSLMRHLPFYDRNIREGEWHYLSPGSLHRLSTLSLGVVGMGRIGSLLAARMQPWFGRVLGYDPFLQQANWNGAVERVTLEQLFRQAHVISLHLPLTAETSGMVNARLLGLMREGSYLVNTARGGLINLSDLLTALDNGRLRGAALDVLPQEPPAAADPIRHHPRVILSPHAAFYSVEAEQELRRKAVYNIVSWAGDGRPLYYVVEGKSRTSDN